MHLTAGTAFRVFRKSDCIIKPYFSFRSLSAYLQYHPRLTGVVFTIYWLPRKVNYAHIKPSSPHEVANTPTHCPHNVFVKSAFLFSIGYYNSRPTVSFNGWHTWINGVNTGQWRDGDRIGPGILSGGFQIANLCFLYLSR